MADIELTEEELKKYVGGAPIVNEFADPSEMSIEELENAKAGLANQRRVIESIKEHQELFNDGKVEEYEEIVSRGL